MNDIITTDIFDIWLKKLADKNAKTVIKKRIHRAKLGNLGSIGYLREGLWEMKIDFSSGYRIYYKQVGKITYLLLIGGNKSSQDKDIERALKIAEELKI